MRDDRTFIRVHDGLDENPKIAELSDAAFRLLVESWCYCSRNLTDGRIPGAVWRKRGAPKVRRELVVAGLVDEAAGHVEMHDYLEHQRSAAEVAAYKAMKSGAGSLGNHERHHVQKGVIKPGCPLCVDPGSHNPSQVRSQVRGVRDRTSVAETETETDTPTHVGGNVTTPGVRSAPPAFPDHCDEHANVAEPPPCGRCADRRKALAGRPRLALVPSADSVFHRPPWCGQCNEFTRQLEVGEDARPVHCPRCHPLAVEVS